MHKHSVPLQLPGCRGADWTPVDREKLCFLRCVVFQCVAGLTNSNSESVSLRDPEALPPEAFSGSM